LHRSEAAIGFFQSQSAFEFGLFTDWDVAFFEAKKQLEAVPPALFLH
jgi:hypothetical protein